ncbi:M1 family metallopeptidase [Marivirga sp. S37H4]|uniref:M1 family metallopeptidase n=1 Tax=Marivirga aurantiaca TaxID=2802615 RepID=A0A935CA67_9BACT|nr:M1 family metallopeptidase [Marivirga aurantiaca]MBK6266022.1 M1 family metallopeptidase [Marivirga aurantiaca]
MKNLFRKTLFPVLSFIILSGTISLKAQDKESFTRADSLKGGLTAERTWWDLTYYHLEVAVDIDNKSLSGKNEIHYTVLDKNNIMQLDLQQPMKIDKVIQGGKELKFESEGAAHFIKLNEQQSINENNKLTIYFSGTPIEAKNPPWDGGITWKEDKNGKPFVASSNQGIGASVWWPCKEHPYDEPDSMLISVNVPKPLINVSNGRLRNVEEYETTHTYHWFVSNPINNYGVNINIGDYVNFKEVYDGEKGPLDCSYWVLSYNLEKAKKQFKDVPKMLKAFEYWFGPYPFYEDGYKLVEAPYLGMEHQSSVTYGNGYQNGYKGRDLSQTGWGMKFDFIIIHESGHEWFANNITYNDVADMWIHESFTHYSETLFLDYHYGTEAGNAYIQGVRSSIQNDRPIIGKYGVSYEGSGDMYYKGGNMLHTLRQLFDDDEKWRTLLRDLNEEFYHQTVSSEQVEDFIEKSYGQSLQGFFDQYLRDTRIPTLTYRILNNNLLFKWENTNDLFNIPIKIYINGEPEWIQPSPTQYKSLENLPENVEISVDPNFYVAKFNLTE